ncbi:MAG: alpha/beta hydrolase-fold protein [Pseudomonadota bacterium]
MLGRYLFWSLLIFIGLGIDTPSIAQEPTIAEFEITGSEVRTIESAVLDRTYDLYKKLPPGYTSLENEDRQYPVIFFNDGGYNWLTAVGATRAPFSLGGYEPAILIGLSYAKGERGVASRVRDYTPADNPEWTRFETGGAADYLTFLKEEVIPFIDSEYKTDPDRRTIVGHSLGGLFGAYVLLTEQGLFSDYILSSPSLLFHNQVIYDMEAEIATTDADIRGRVFISVGSTETPDVNGGKNDMVGQTKSFAEVLRSRGYDNLQVKDVVHEDGTHLTSYPSALVEALQWMLPGENIYGG